MNGINKQILVGFLGIDPETTTLDSGVKVARFTLAVDDSYHDKNGVKVEQTDWFNIVVWRGLADVAEKYLKKGSQIYVDGKTKNRAYENKEGVKCYTSELVAENLRLLDRKEAGTDGNQ